jgi:hypothetical protein
MKIASLKLSVAAFFIISFAACKKDNYKDGGTIPGAKVNMTTYDFLKGQSSGLFDTLILLVDKAGVKEKINKQGVTFFAPTDYAIRNYLNRRALEEQRIDPFRNWTIDSLIKYELNKMVDSTDVYIINEALSYGQLSQDGKIYATAKPGAQSVVSYEETTDPALGYNPNVSTIPRLVYYTLLFGPLDPPFKANEIPADIGTRDRVQTSGIETTTGMLNVLSNNHTLFYHK